MRGWNADSYFEWNKRLAREREEQHLKAALDLLPKPTEEQLARAEERIEAVRQQQQQHKHRGASMFGTHATEALIATVIAGAPRKVKREELRRRHVERLY